MNAIGQYVISFASALLSAIFVTVADFPALIQNLSWVGVGFCGGILFVETIRRRP